MKKYAILILIFTLLLLQACSRTNPDTQQAALPSPTPSPTEPNAPDIVRDIPPEISEPEQKPVKSEPCVVPLTPNPIPKEKQRPFIVTYETYVPDATVIILLHEAYDAMKNLWYPTDIEYDCDMDGIYEEQRTNTDYGIPIGCRFEKPGLHQIAMRGDLPHLVLDHVADYEDYTDNFNLISIDQWGDIRWKSMSWLLAYRDKSNPDTHEPHYPELRAKDTPDLRDVCDMSGMFAGNKTFNSPIGHWDVSHIEDMGSTFASCTSFNQDISAWDVSNVKYMNSMFANATSFDQDISKWDVSNVTAMGDMFMQATSFNQDISKWNVSNVKYMFRMFEDAISFDQDLSRWDVTSLTSVYGMFASKDKTKTICPKCESLRQKILKKNEHLAPYQDPLDFTPKDYY